MGKVIEKYIVIISWLKIAMSKRNGSSKYDKKYLILNNIFISFIIESKNIIN